MNLQRLVISPTQRQNQHILLTDSQQHYLVRVLRLSKGDRFIAMDGQGNWWLSELAANLSAAIIIESIPIQTELPCTITLMAAMPKGSGFEDIISGATELGVTCIMPIKSDRTILNPSPRKLERWRRIAQEAAEQSERQIVPRILDPLDFTSAIEQAIHSTTHCYICVARGNVPHLLNCLPNSEVFNSKPEKGDEGGLSNIRVTTNDSSETHPYLQNQVPSNPVKGQNHALEHGEGSKLPVIAIATGPEGGWTPAEIEQAIVAGFQPVSLGHRILRAVTAPLMALSLIAASLEVQQVNSR
ncbi:MAG: 16S rRNA (uracil(1498)-N(3))-methyltransferase [Coleofasciculus sp. G3-WIS-01]|uniref:RsmE family RNA methyltransferase n=1 Tax=Coleofasciculus sp. G3-WIS-01 TaxID=3069528 RepID=UPI0032FBBFAE